MTTATETKDFLALSEVERLSIALAAHKVKSNRTVLAWLEGKASELSEKKKSLEVEYKENIKNISNEEKALQLTYQQAKGAHDKFRDSLQTLLKSVLKAAGIPEEEWSLYRPVFDDQGEFASLKKTTDGQ